MGRRYRDFVRLLIYIMQIKIISWLEITWQQANESAIVGRSDSRMMVGQKTSEWSSESSNMEYFTRQIEKPYQSTIAFFDFLESVISIGSDTLIVDACCGSGSNTIYAARRFGLKHTIGFDYQEEFLALAQKYYAESLNTKRQNITFKKMDIYNTKELRKSIKQQAQKVDGIIFLQTMSWLTKWKKSLDGLSRIKSKWLAMSSLFYEGKIEAEITIKTYADSEKQVNAFPYNVYSKPLVEKYLKKLGFKELHWQKFTIESPLTKPTDIDKMGTYTVETKGGDLMQVSGPILMPWYFLIAIR